MCRQTSHLFRSNGFAREFFFLSLLLIIFPVSQSIDAQTTPEVTALESDKPLEREIAGGQKHIYQINFTENQYAKLLVEQRGIDVSARAFGADGKLIAEFDSELRTQGAETVEIVALSAGIYKLEVESKQKTSPAGRYEISIAELRPATAKDAALQKARSMILESLGLSRAGNSKNGLPPAESALEIREKYLGSEDAAVAAVLNILGNLHYELDDDDAKAETLFKRALSIYEKKSSPDDLDAAAVLSNLAVIYRIRGDLVEAEKLFQRVLSVRERTLGQNHTLVAAALNNLGLLYRVRGDNAKAQQMYERSLEIRERLFGKDSLEIASVLMNLSSLYYYKGDFAAALTLDRRVLEIREKHLEADHPSIARALDNVALDYTDSGEFEKALPLYERVLAIYKKKIGRDNFESTSSLNNLAKLYIAKGEYDKAEPLFQKALQVAEKKLGRDVLRITLYLHNLGDFYALKGDYAQSEPLLKRALEIRERILGAEHYDVGRTCDALARLYSLKGDVAQAITFQLRANKINEKNIALNLAVGSERQKLSYMSLMLEDQNQTISLHVKTAQENTDARDQAMTMILQRKGRVLDAMTDNLAALRRRFDAKDAALFDRLNDANARLAELTLNEPPKTMLAEYQKRISAIQEQKNNLESEISRRSEGFYERSKPVTIAAVQAVIPEDSALVEFAVYRQLDAKSKDGKIIYGKPQYAVYVIRRQGVVKWKDLGEAAPLDADIERFRQVLRDPKRRDIAELARVLDEKVMQPIRALTGDAVHLLISPDGNLNLIPFEALVDEQNRYLIERYSFTYLTSGRDLLRMQTARQSVSSPLIMANPLFGEPDASQTAQSTKLNTRRNKRKSVTATRNLSDTYFAPLGGTLREGRSIQTLFPDATFLSEAQATETALKQTTAPRILHIATHGFFLEDKDVSRDANTKIENPLLRSGLALAGANRHGGDRDDGILTALEASCLNLWGTKLVVLSACYTGLGEVKNGEGVYGLRRAFVLAGTESLLMSLWSVSDYATREIMTSYYKNLKQGMGRNAALRRAQLEMLKNPKRQHPFYWAAFIQSGEWANLDGKR